MRISDWSSDVCSSDLIPFMPAVSYSDVVLMPDGTTVKSLTVSNPNGIAAGIDSLYNSFHSNLYTTNFEAHWRGDRAQINASVQYNWSNEGNYFVEQILRPGDLTSASIDFVSDQYKDRKSQSLKSSH